jgi:hypothetical protein
VRSVEEKAGRCIRRKAIGCVRCVEHLHVLYVILWKCQRDDVRSEVLKDTTMKVPSSVCELTDLPKFLNLLPQCYPSDSELTA